MRNCSPWHTACSGSPHNALHSSSIGFVTNGKFNYLRTKGYTCPLSVLQVQTNVCNKYKNIRKPALLAMLTPEHKLQLSQSAIHFTLFISLKFPCIHSELPDGTVVAQRDSQAVPHTRDLGLDEK